MWMVVNEDIATEDFMYVSMVARFAGHSKGNLDHLPKLMHR